MNLAGNLLLLTGLIVVCLPSLTRISLWLLRRPRRPRRIRKTLSYPVATAGCVIMVAGNVLLGSWPWTAFFAVATAGNVWVWQRERAGRHKPDDGGFLDA